MRVDLRSDTMTRPTPEMRRAMAAAEVGNDAYGEDPTVNALQDAFAERVGKEAALFVPSGTMANQLALRVLARPATLVVAGRTSHIVAFENGAGAYNTGAQLHPVADVRQVGEVIAATAHHQPSVSLVCVENTLMAAGGTVIPLGEIEAVAAHGLPMHLDGARLWNAEVATGVPLSAWAAPATTVMCCLSKGLCAPVGSLLASDAEVIAEARVHRHRLGGGMCQAGVIAAAGLVAMDTMVERLVDDHRRASVLAAAVQARWPDREIAAPQTNIVTFSCDDPDALIEHLAAHGVLAGTVAPGIVRFVTHHDVDDEGIAEAAAAISSYAGR
ncbi:MAG: threonine aldolase family protein [Acidimicrobiales bacterium]